jgi:hypothetical protein
VVEPRKAAQHCKDAAPRDMLKIHRVKLNGHENTVHCRLGRALGTVSGIEHEEPRTNNNTKKEEGARLTEETRKKECVEYLNEQIRTTMMIAIMILIQVL